MRWRTGVRRTPATSAAFFKAIPQIAVASTWHRSWPSARSVRIDLARFTERHGVLFVVHELTVKFHQPALLNGMLSVGADVVKLGGASLVFRQTVERSGTLLVEAEVKVALIDRSRMKPARLPEELQQALE